MVGVPVSDSLSVKRDEPECVQNEDRREQRDRKNDPNGQGIDHRIVVLVFAKHQAVKSFREKTNDDQKNSDDEIFNSR